MHMTSEDAKRLSTRVAADSVLDAFDYEQRRSADTDIARHPTLAVVHGTGKEVHAVDEPAEPKDLVPAG